MKRIFNLLIEYFVLRIHYSDELGRTTKLGLIGSLELLWMGFGLQTNCFSRYGSKHMVVMITVVAVVLTVYLQAKC